MHTFRDNVILTDGNAQLMQTAEEYNSMFGEKLDSPKLEKDGVRGLDFCCDVQMVRSEFGINKMKPESMDPPCLVSMVQAGGGGGVLVVVYRLHCFIVYLGSWGAWIPSQKT